MLSFLVGSLGSNKPENERDREREGAIREERARENYTVYCLEQTKVEKRLKENVGCSQRDLGLG